MVFVVGQAVMTLTLKGLAEGNLEDAEFSMTRRAGLRSYETYMAPCLRIAKSRRARKTIFASGRRRWAVAAVAGYRARPDSCWGVRRLCG